MEDHKEMTSITQKKSKCAGRGGSRPGAGRKKIIMDSNDKAKTKVYIGGSNIRKWQLLKTAYGDEGDILFTMKLLQLAEKELKLSKSHHEYQGSEKAWNHDHDHGEYICLKVSSSLNYWFHKLLQHSKLRVSAFVIKLLILYCSQVKVDLCQTNELETEINHQDLSDCQPPYSTILQTDTRNIVQTRDGLSTIQTRVSSPMVTHVDACGNLSNLSDDIALDLLVQTALHYLGPTADTQSVKKDNNDRTSCSNRINDNSCSSVGSECNPLQESIMTTGRFDDDGQFESLNLLSTVSANYSQENTRKKDGVPCFLDRENQQTQTEQTTFSSSNDSQAILAEKSVSHVMVSSLNINPSRVPVTTHIRTSELSLSSIDKKSKLQRCFQKALQGHKRTLHHAKIKNVPCPNHVCSQCLSTFKTKPGLNKHKNSVHAVRKFVCDFSLDCHRTFSTAAMQKKHILRMHLRVKPFECSYDGCQNAFFSKDELNRHLRVHTKERLYACQWPKCNKSFRTKYHLTVHLRVHNNEKPLKCPHAGCKYRARQKASVNWHVKKNH